MEPQNSTVAGRVSPPSVSDIKSEKPTATEPRITNDKEGSRKQKDAIRKLASYNSEVGSRMEKKRREVGGADSGEKAEKAEETERTEGTEVAERVEKVEGAEEPIGESVGLSNGNIIAGMGVAVAAICLYLSYRSGAPGGPPLPPPPPPPPQPPRFVGSAAQSSGSAFQPVIQAPRFMRL